MIIMDNNASLPDIGAMISALTSNPAIMSMLLQLINKGNNSTSTSPNGSISNTDRNYNAPQGLSSEHSATAFGNNNNSVSSGNEIGELLKLISAFSSAASKPQNSVPHGNSADIRSNNGSYEPPCDCPPPPPKPESYPPPPNRSDRPPEHHGTSGFGVNISDQLKRLLGGKTEAENRICLINALRPYLSEDRRCKADMLVKLLKLAELGVLKDILC